MEQWAKKWWITSPRENVALALDSFLRPPSLLGSVKISMVVGRHWETKITDLDVIPSTFEMTLNALNNCMFRYQNLFQYVPSSCRTLGNAPKMLFYLRSASKRPLARSTGWLGREGWSGASCRRTPRSCLHRSRGCQALRLDSKPRLRSVQWVWIDVGRCRWSSRTLSRNLKGNINLWG